MDGLMDWMVLPLCVCMTINIGIRCVVLYTRGNIAFKIPPAIKKRHHGLTYIKSQ